MPKIPRRTVVRERASLFSPQVAVAFIGLIGVAATAVLANWERIRPSATVPDPQSAIGKAAVKVHLDPQPLELRATVAATLNSNADVGQWVTLSIFIDGALCTTARNYRNPHQSGAIKTTANCSTRISPNQAHVFIADAPNQNADQESLSIEVKYAR
ncbi:hypothetical protein [Variovorax rhizosphaerae]|uniref:Uncharacterized protein n=1 Tax=Variovorax rhizosphaerae TaxID=1836200 RepID=A0ABU8WXS6_9BURK